MISHSLTSYPLQSPPNAGLLAASVISTHSNNPAICEVIPKSPAEVIGEIIIRPLIDSSFSLAHRSFTVLKNGALSFDHIFSNLFKLPEATDSYEVPEATDSYEADIDNYFDKSMPPLHLAILGSNF